jgi:hypothetical protein
VSRGQRADPLQSLNSETLIDDSKEVGIEVNVENTMYMLVSHEQNADQNRDLKEANRSFENVSQFSIWEQQ